MDIRAIYAVNGIYIYPFKDMEEILKYTDENKKMLIALNAGKLDRSDEMLKELINKNIGYADGIGAVMILRKRGIKDSVKIPGCELWLKIVERYYASKSFYLVGGKQDIIEHTITKLSQEFEGINIVGYRDGYIKNVEERKALIEDIILKKPDIVFVAMGSPIQENLMADMQKVHHNCIYQGLGGSFDVYAGEAKRAPNWVLKLGIEGIYRFLTRISDPKIRSRFMHDLWFVIKINLGISK